MTSDQSMDDMVRELRQTASAWRRKANEGIGPHSRGEIHVYEQNADEIEGILERYTNTGVGREDDGE